MCFAWVLLCWRCNGVHQRRAKAFAAPTYVCTVAWTVALRQLRGSTCAKHAATCGHTMCVCAQFAGVDSALQRYLWLRHAIDVSHGQLVVHMTQADSSASSSRENIHDPSRWNGSSCIPMVNRPLPCLHVSSGRSWRNFRDFGIPSAGAATVD